MKTRGLTQAEKDFSDAFESACGKLSAWEAWATIIDSIACAISNAGDPDAERVQKREEEYKQCFWKLGGMKPILKAFCAATEALTLNPAQDFLGKMFMQFELSNHWRGQFFTPFDMAEAMAKMGIGDTPIEKKGWASVHDPACGAGATLIGAIEAFKGKYVDFQNRIAFIGCDIDRTVAQMCYIQLSLLGCAGYVVVTDSLANPLMGSALFPQEKSGQEFWYTPMWWSPIWTCRRLFNSF